MSHQPSNQGIDNTCTCCNKPVYGVFIRNMFDNSVFSARWLPKNEYIIDQYEHGKPSRKIAKELNISEAEVIHAVESVGYL